MLPDHVSQHPACGVDIGPLVHLVATRLLGGHVLRRTRSAHALGAQKVREPEVEEFHPSVVAEEHVRGLDPCAHPALVRMREPFRHLLRDAQGLALGNRPFRDALRQRLATQQFHHEIRA